MESRPTLHVASKILFYCGWFMNLLVVCSEHYFMDEPLVTGARGVASDAENRDPWDLPYVIMITGML